VYIFFRESVYTPRVMSFRNWALRTQLDGDLLGK